MSLVIVGAGGLAREVFNWFRGQTDVKGFRDTPRYTGETLYGLPVQADLEGDAYVVVIADSLPRKRRVIMDLGNAAYATLIHWLALSFSRLGFGSVQGPFSKLGPNVRVGYHVFLNVGCTVGHDSTIGDYTFIGPNANIAGYSHIGTGVYFGSNSTLINKVTVGDWSIIGSGAVVNRDIPPHSVAVGVPAKVIRRLDIGESDDCDERVQRRAVAPPAPPAD